MPREGMEMPKQEGKRVSGKSAGHSERVSLEREGDEGEGEGEGGRITFTVSVVVSTLLVVVHFITDTVYGQKKYLQMERETQTAPRSLLGGGRQRSRVRLKREIQQRRQR